MRAETDLLGGPEDVGILVDATKGLLPQTRRHTYMASLLGISNVVAAVNKMDLAEYSEEVFAKLSDDFAALAASLGIRFVQCVPVSALEGDAVVGELVRMLGAGQGDRAASQHARQLLRAA